MISLIGTYYDGQSSTSLSVRVRIWPEFNCINIIGDDFEREYALDEIKISSRVADTPRRLNFPDGASLETANNAAVDALQPKRFRKAHSLESKLAWVLVALLITGVAVWFSITQGIPYLAERTAYSFPAPLEQQMGKHSLEALDKLAFSPSKLTPQQQERGRQIFSSLLAGIGEGGAAHLEFRAMKDNIANAFTLPSGIVVVTDHLMEIADQDKELQAVLAHELGHAHYHHPLRLWLQSSAVALLTASVLGDASAIAASAATLPTVLLQNQYSHAFEEQADDFAVGMLEKRGIARCHLGVILRKLEASQPKNIESLPTFLSTHPSTENRIERLQGQGKTACRQP